MMTCSGTEYSHEVFFYTQNVSNFWVCLFCFFYSGCYYWGSEMTGTAVPLCSASNKMGKTHFLSTFSFVKGHQGNYNFKRKEKQDFPLACVKQGFLMAYVNRLKVFPNMSGMGVVHIYQKWDGSGIFFFLEIGKEQVGRLTDCFPNFLPYVFRVDLGLSILWPPKKTTV